MPKYLINHFIAILSTFLCFNSLFANEYKGRTTIDSLGYYLDPSLISPDGNWVIVSKTFAYKNQPESIFYINTKTKQKIEIDDYATLNENLLYNDLILQNKDNKLTVLNLKKDQKTFVLPNIKQFTSKAIRDNNLLITLSNENTLKIIKLDKQGNLNKILVSEQNVGKYLINKDKTKLIYQKQDTDNLTYAIDLQSFKIVEFKDHIDNLKSINWNFNQNKIAFVNNENKLYLLNLNTGKTNILQLSKDSLERLEIFFYSNDDLFIKYNVKTNEKIEESKYLDIWNGNSRYLYPSTFKQKYKLEYKAFVYKYTTNTLHELNRTRDYDYQFINLPNHILAYNPFKFQDFTSTSPKIQYDLLDINNLTTIKSITDRNTSGFIASNDGNYVIYPIDETKWEVLNIKTKEYTTIDCDNSTNVTPVWSSDSKHIFYAFKNKLMRFDLSNKKQVTILDNITDARISFSNKNRLNNKLAATIDTQKPILVTLKNNNNTWIYKIDKNKSQIIIDSKGNDLSRVYSHLGNLTTKDLNTIVYTEENYNLPISIKVFNHGKISTLLESNMPKHLYAGRKKETITFNDKFEKELKGTLYYPKNFDKNKKYPMVVYIYGEENTDIKEFILPTTLNSIGFNIPLLNDNGYFVYYVQSYVSDQGVGISAVESVTSGVNAILQKEQAIDNQKLGLIGHSFGAYKASFIATQTNMFSAIISGAGAHDIIVGNMYRYNLHRNKLNWFIVEKGQYQFKQTYAQNPQKYLDNSPILHAHKIKTPILLWTGLKDENVPWENTRNMYAALKRYQISTIALFYKNIDHAIMPNQSIEDNDLTFRVMDWFDYFLKDNKDIDWINKGIDPDNYTWNQLDGF